MSQELKVNRFHMPEQMFEAAADNIMEWLNELASEKDICSLALSGGITPDGLFKVLVNKYFSANIWSVTHIFWVDERNVPPGHPASNFGRAWSFLSQIATLPENNVHRIEAEHPDGAERYTMLLDSKILPKNSFGLPVFDVVVLGIGKDGHVASLFPHSPLLYEKNKIAGVTLPPETAEPKIPRTTITLPVINAARKTVFLVTGKEKIDLLQCILNQRSEEYPASLVAPDQSAPEWYVSL